MPGKLFRQIEELSVGNAVEAQLDIGAGTGTREFKKMDDLSKGSGSPPSCCSCSEHHVHHSSLINPRTISITGSCTTGSSRTSANLRASARSSRAHTTRMFRSSAMRNSSSLWRAAVRTASQWKAALIARRRHHPCARGIDPRGWTGGIQRQAAPVRVLTGSPKADPMNKVSNHLSLFTIREYLIFEVASLKMLSIVSDSLSPNTLSRHRARAVLGRLVRDSCRICGCVCGSRKCLGPRVQSRSDRNSSGRTEKRHPRPPTAQPEYCP